MTLNETAAELRLGPTKLGQLTARGELPVVRFGRRLLVTRRDLDAYIEAHREGAPLGATGSDQLPVARGGRRASANRSVRA
jgi:excisionase family DNA binding protein